MEAASSFQPCAVGIGSSSILTQIIATLLSAQCGLSPVYPPNRASDHLNSYDFIVVGSGSAGSPLAARLSDNPNWNILLIEAGEDPSQDSDTPLLFFFNQQDKKIDWSYFTEPQKHGSKAMNNHQSYWARAKVLGGCSSINAMIYQTGNKRDYDDWEHLTGFKNWGWSSVEKYFNNHMVNELTPANPYQATNNAIDADVEAMRRIILEASTMLGLKVHEAPVKKSRSLVGYFRSLMTIRNGTRVNTARAYLSPLKNRENIHVIKGGTVTKVLIDPLTRQTEGVEVSIDGRLVRINANKEVILSTGSINTPQILMLSGVGPRDHLEKHSIETIVDLPGVGQHLLDHSNTVVSIKLKPPGAREWNELLGSQYVRYLKTQEGIFGTTGVTNIIGYINTEDPQSIYPNMGFYYLYIPQNDQSLLPLLLKDVNFKRSIVDTYISENKNSPLLLVFTTLLKPKSYGTVTLKSNDPFESPLMDPRYNSERQDLVQIRKAIQHIQDLIKTRPFAEINANFVKFDLPECDVFEFTSDEYWNCYIEHFVTTLYHPVGTARMGGADDSGAVVDEKLRVKGIKGLRVADGSIMPSIVGANTNGPIIMIGEKLADIIKDEYGIKHIEL